MAPYSSPGPASWDASGPSTRSAYHRVAFLPLSQAGGIDSNDVSGCGCQFSNAAEHTERGEPYPNDLEVSDDENDPDYSPHSSPHPNSPADRSPTVRSTSFLGSSSSAAETPERERRYLNPGPYLSPQEYKQYEKNKRSRSIHSGSSGVQSDQSSQYLSARPCPPSVTSFTGSHRQSEPDDQAPSSHYYTPSHTTPSHHSRGTTEGVEEEGSDIDAYDNDRLRRTTLHGN